MEGSAVRYFRGWTVSLLVVLLPVFRNQNDPGINSILGQLCYPPFSINNDLSALFTVCPKIALLVSVRRRHQTRKA